MDWLKFLIFGVATVGSLVLGFKPGGIAEAKPAWWRWLTIGSLFLLVFLSFYTPTSGTFSGMSMVQVGRGDDAVVPVRGKVVDAGSIGGVATAKFEDRHGKTEVVDLSQLDEGDRKEFTDGKDMILALERRPDGVYNAHYIVSINPYLSIPLVPALEERARNIYYHVPVAIITQIAWFIAVLFAVLYLRKRDQKHDIIASSAALVGALFCVLATTTGMVWAKFNWGSFWNWDPRQVSIFVVLIIYGAYFALRSAIPNTEQRARISSLYLILLLLPVIFFIFVYPRINPGLHPGALGGESIGPVIDPQKLWLDQVKQVYFALGLFSFTLLYFWLVNLSARMRLVELRKKLGEIHQNVKGREATGITAIDR